jgi:hypothetical protein
MQHATAVVHKGFYTAETVLIQKSSRCCKKCVAVAKLIHLCSLEAALVTANNGVRRSLSALVQQDTVSGSTIGVPLARQSQFIQQRCQSGAIAAPQI